MFGSGIKLFSILGFEVKLDFSWVFIATLVVWSLATAYFPKELAGLSPDIYWLMAVVAMLGLFFSIIFAGISTGAIGLEIALYSSNPILDSLYESIKLVLPVNKPYDLFTDPLIDMLRDGTELLKPCE